MVSRSALLHRIPERVAEGRAVLTERGWLAKTPPAFQEALLEVGIWKTASAGETFIHAGDVDGGLFGLAAGTAEVAVESGHPDARFITLEHAGYWAGHRPLIGKGRNVSLTARGEMLWLLVPKRAVERLLAEEPAFWRQIVFLTDIAFENAVSIAVDLTRQNGRSRVTAALLRLAGCRYSGPGPTDVVDILVPQSDLAAIAVMSRNTMGGYLAELARLQFIDVSYRSIRILNAAGMRAMLEMEE